MVRVVQHLQPALFAVRGPVGVVREETRRWSVTSLTGRRSYAGSSEVRARDV